jgi:hypothetical protein
MTGLKLMVSLNKIRRKIEVVNRIKGRSTSSGQRITGV